MARALKISVIVEDTHSTHGVDLFSHMLDEMPLISPHPAIVYSAVKDNISRDGV